MLLFFLPILFFSELVLPSVPYWFCFDFKVGDNVGDCAARGADLFESIAAEIISAMILGGSMAQRCKIAGKYLSCSIVSLSCLLLIYYLYSCPSNMMFSILIQIHRASSCFLLLFTPSIWWYRQLEYFLFGEHVKLE